MDNGSNWEIIDARINLTNEYYKWATPAVTTTALLKMTIGSNQFISNFFPISARTLTGVGFNCRDSFLFYWHKIAGVNNYRIYTLGPNYLEPILTTSDRFAVFKKSTNPSLYYAAAPLVGNQEGVKSYTINYTLQGVECYIRAFVASLANNTAELTLSLGTLYNISGLVLEKYNGIDFIPIQQQPTNNSLIVIFKDSNLSNGINMYRVKVALAGARVVYTLPETVYHFSGSDYIIYPNPSQQYNEIKVAVKNVDEARMEIYNAIGIKVLEKTLDNRVNKIPTGKLSKGVYYIKITNNGIKEALLKLIVN